MKKEEKDNVLQSSKFEYNGPKDEVRYGIFSGTILIIFLMVYIQYIHTVIHFFPKTYIAICIYMYTEDEKRKLAWIQPKKIHIIISLCPFQYFCFSYYISKILYTTMYEYMDTRYNIYTLNSMAYTEYKSTSPPARESGSIAG